MGEMFIKAVVILSSSAGFDIYVLLRLALKGETKKLYAEAMESFWLHD